MREKSKPYYRVQRFIKVLRIFRIIFGLSIVIGAFIAATYFVESKWDISAVFVISLVGLSYLHEPKRKNKKTMQQHIESGRRRNRSRY